VTCIRETTDKKPKNLEKLEPDREFLRVRCINEEKSAKGKKMLAISR
jgi:hypothetical protein